MMKAERLTIITLILSIMMAIAILSACSTYSRVDLKDESFGIFHYNVDPNWDKSGGDERDDFVLYKSDYNQVMSFGISEVRFNSENALPASDQISGVIEAYRKAGNVSGFTQTEEKIDGSAYKALSFRQGNASVTGYADKQNVLIVLVPDKQTLYYLSFCYSDGADNDDAVNVRDSILQSIKLTKDNVKNNSD